MKNKKIETAMKNQPQITTNFELKRCKCEKECGRCKAIKTSQLEKINQN
jgi:hypothetical protein